jgi:hypothetical protein
MTRRSNWGPLGSTFYATTTVESLRFSPCGRYLAIGQRYQPVLIHELATGNLLAAVPTDSRNRSVDFSADGELCLVVGEGNRSAACQFANRSHPAQTHLSGPSTVCVFFTAFGLDRLHGL